MNKLLIAFMCVGTFFAGYSANGVSAGTVVKDSARTTVYTNSAGASTSGLRGNQGAVNAYIQNQRNTYFLVTQPDIDTACRQKIYNCLADYCGDPTVVVPGQTSGRCSYVSETELYNYALLCLQKDYTVLKPEYSTMTKNGGAGIYTAARLCPQYVQQELISYLSMMNMADQLTKSHSDLCLQRRRELEAAMACHSIALAYGNETTSMLTTQLTDYCGAGVTGGSAEMVTRFVNAGNVGANIWGWADKIVGLELNSKGSNWEAAVDAILASYTNRMNLACGDDMKLEIVSHPTSSGNANLQAAASFVSSVAFPTTNTTKQENPYEDWSVYMEVTSMSDIYNYDTANTVIQAGLTNSPLTQNAFLTSTQMDDMQKARVRGTKAFIIRDSARCYIIPVETLTQRETSMIAQLFANCVSK